MSKRKTRRKRVAISVGDLNGVGIELILRNHQRIKRVVEPIYCIGDVMLNKALSLLDITYPAFFNNVEVEAKDFDIIPSQIYADSGNYSYASFVRAIELIINGEADAICTLPINKKAWELAGVNFKGHTDMLREVFSNDEIIMMLGCENMSIGLYTEHIPLKFVPKAIDRDRLL